MSSIFGQREAHKSIFASQNPIVKDLLHIFGLALCQKPSHMRLYLDDLPQTELSYDSGLRLLVLSNDNLIVMLRVTAAIRFHSISSMVCVTFDRNLVDNESTCVIIFVAFDMLVYFLINVFFGCIDVKFASRTSDWDLVYIHGILDVALFADSLDLCINLAPAILCWYVANLFVS